MKLNNELYILDGGLSNAIKRLGGNINDELWTAQLIDKNSDLIVKAHLNYLNAGADIIITSSYQASIDGFTSKGYTLNEAEELIIKTTNLALKAKKEYQKGSSKEVYIAGSIGPYAAYLADGSEYTGQYSVDKSILYEFHQKRIKLLDKTPIDLFAVETIPSLEEVEVLNEILHDTIHKAWVSVVCKNGKELSDGTSIKEVAQLISSNTNILGIGINCTHPKYIKSLISEILNSDYNNNIVIYPNAGMVYDADTKNWIGTSKPEEFIHLAKKWKKLGVKIIGGCCEIGEDHIKKLNDELRN
ncbi:homocysteine S-methyltransferase [Flammeovirga pacifica]|uniref:Homocysteine S-methyltransferase n=1 Tax=Flammeovirga pacifica TaxID=915059 RepID=A0A1S1YV05_FLAPC|nr:homocysteine S-methyltransferase [Flammeovirga pacifica]OHX64856.1 homocysteine S-methyltransferase [Flammeovirga pacifica]